VPWNIRASAVNRAGLPDIPVRRAMSLVLREGFIDIPATAGEGSLGAR
jgi:hypothetical protein